MKPISIELLLKEIFDEGRFEDAQKKHPSSSEILWWAKDEGLKPKYIDWFVKQTQGMPLFDLDFEQRDEIGLIIKKLKEFDELAEKKRIKQRDITQYKTLEDVLKTIDAANVSSEKRNQGNKASKDADVIYQDPNLLVIRPKTVEASCKYGSGTQWCISGKNENQFDSYDEQGAEFYFFINKKNGDKDALVVFPDEPGKDPAVFDSSDKEYGIMHLLTKYPIDTIKSVLQKAGLNIALPNEDSIKHMSSLISNPTETLKNTSDIELTLNELITALGEDISERIFLNLLEQYEGANRAIDSALEYIWSTYIYPDSWAIPSLRHLYKLTQKLLGHSNKVLSGIPLEVIASIFNQDRNEELGISENVFFDLLESAIQVLDTSGYVPRKLYLLHNIGQVGLQNGFLGPLLEKRPELFAKLYSHIMQRDPKAAQKFLSPWIAGYISSKYNIGIEIVLALIKAVPTFASSVSKNLYDDPKLLASTLSIILKHYGAEPTKAETEKIAEIFYTTKGDLKKLLPPEIQSIITESTQSAVKQHYQKFLSD